MNNNIPILHNINYLKSFLIFLISKQKISIILSLFITLSLILLYFFIFIDKKYIYTSTIHPNLQIPEILELRNDIYNKTNSNLDFNSYLASTINRFFTTKQNLYNAISKYDLLNFEEILTFETNDTSQLLNMENQKIKLKKLFSFTAERIKEPSDNLYSNENISINLYDHLIKIESIYNLDEDYLFSIILKSHVAYTIESIKNYIILYEDFLQKQLKELNQKIVESEKAEFENKGFIKYQLKNEIIVNQNALDRLKNSAIVLLIKDHNSLLLNSGDNMKGLKDLFYISTSSKNAEYNYDLLSIFIFISLLFTIFLLFTSYLNFIKYNSKNK